MGISGIFTPSPGKKHINRFGNEDETHSLRLPSNNLEFRVRSWQRDTNLTTGTTLLPSKEIHIHPGEVYVTGEDRIIKTLLGSCVAVCLYDARRLIGGMNHMMLPICRQGDRRSTKYGNIAVHILYDMVRAQGCRKHDLTARIFGGAHGLIRGRSFGLSVGPRNVEVAERVLARLSIPIVGRDVGGHQGRKIFFDVSSGKIRLAYIHNYKFAKEEIILTEGNRRKQGNRR